MPQPVAIFYSWQADLPNSVTRGFIEDALDRAARSVKTQPTAAAAPVEFLAAVDRDTRGHLGSPDIAATIFSKIDRCDIFICDVSIVNTHKRTRRDRLLDFVASSKSEPAPNANVMVELGYAAGKLGWDRVICVCNTAFGAVESLPFDVRSRRVIPYRLLPGAEKTEQRKSLTSALRHALAPLFRNAWQVHRPHPLRFAAFADLALASNRFLNWLSALHYNTRTAHTEDDWSTIFNHEVFTETLVHANMDHNLTFAGGVRCPLGHEIVRASEEFAQSIAKILGRYGTNLEPLLYEALHRFESSTLRNTIALLPSIEATDQRTRTPRPRVMSSYAVATERDLRSLQVIAEWCQRERSELRQYDPDILDVEPPVRRGTPGVYRIDDAELARQFAAWNDPKRRA
jgi:hypothetical protein